MDYLTNILFVCYTIVLLIDAIDAEDLDKTSRKRAFCGKRLTAIMSRFCLEYPTRSEDNPIRIKRQIVSECCQNKCSLNYLLENYCQTINIAALETFIKEDDVSGERTFSTLPPPTPLSKRYRQNYNLDNIQYAKPNKTSHVQNNNRKRRQCTCKKHYKRKINRETILWQILANRNFTIREPQVGSIQDQENPFYILFPKL